MSDYEDEEEIHHSYFIALSLGVLVVAGLFGCFMVQVQQAQLRAKKDK